MPHPRVQPGADRLMPYPGAPVPGAPAPGAWTQTLTATLTLTKFSVSPSGTNVYLLTGPDGSLLIDAADDAARILRFLGGDRLQTIVTTHRHTDHLRALAEVARITGARLICGTPDRAAIEHATHTVQDPVWTGSKVSAPGGAHLEVIGLPGHTPGAILLAYTPEHGPSRIFGGDALFSVQQQMPGSQNLRVGPNTSDRSGKFRRMMRGLEAKIFGVYPDETIIHSGHGADTALGAERPYWTWLARRR